MDQQNILQNILETMNDIKKEIKSIKSLITEKTEVESTTTQTTILSDSNSSSIEVINNSCNKEVVLSSSDYSDSEIEASQSLLNVITQGVFKSATVIEESASEEEEEDSMHARIIADVALMGFKKTEMFDKNKKLITDTDVNEEENVSMQGVKRRLNFDNSLETKAVNKTTTTMNEDSTGEEENTSMQHPRAKRRLNFDNSLNSEDFPILSFDSGEDFSPIIYSEETSPSKFDTALPSEELSFSNFGIGLNSEDFSPTKFNNAAEEVDIEMEHNDASFDSILMYDREDFLSDSQIKQRDLRRDIKRFKFTAEELKFLDEDFE